MKKKILSSVLILSLGFNVGVGAAMVSLKGKAEQLELSYGQSIERFYFHLDSELKEVAAEMEKSEGERMEKETREYLSQKMQAKKEILIKEKQDAVTVETNKYIVELKKFIDGSL